MCPLCTYVNVMRSNRCTQCSTKRESSCEMNLATANNVQEQIKALSIRGSDPELNIAHNRTSPLGSNSLSGSRTNLGAAGARISPIEYKSYANSKWTCTVS